MGSVDCVRAPLYRTHKGAIPSGVVWGIWSGAQQQTPNTYTLLRIHTGHPRPPAGAGLCTQRLQDRRRPLPRLGARAVRQGRQCVFFFARCLFVCCVPPAALPPCRPAALPIDEFIQSTRRLTQFNPIQPNPHHRTHHRREGLREPREAGGADGGLLPAHPVVRVPGQRRAQAHHQVAGLHDQLSLWLGVLRCKTGK